MHALLLALLVQGPIDSAVQLVMRTQHIAGLSLGVARDGHTIYARGYGERDSLTHESVEAGTVYRIGSLTKMLTAHVILTLAERRKLDVDRPAARYVLRFPWHGGVTVRDLLAQRSGIPSYTDSSLNRYAWHAPSQLVESVANEPLEFPPGTQFAYSNTNYALLGMIAERVTHRPFEDVLNAQLSALRLHHSRYGDQPDEALGYRWDGTSFVRATASSPAYAYSAAAMSSNVPDLLRFLRDVKAPYYGLLQSEQFGNSVWYASGNVDGYSAFAFVVPSTGEEAVILCNEDQVDLAPLALDILAALQPSGESPGFGPPQNEDPRTSAAVKARAESLFAPLQITLLEFLGRETVNGQATVTYRVTLSNGTRALLRAPLTSDGSIGEISITPL